MRAAAAVLECRNLHPMVQKLLSSNTGLSTHPKLAEILKILRLKMNSLSMQNYGTLLKVQLFIAFLEFHSIGWILIQIRHQGHLEE